MIETLFPDQVLINVKEELVLANEEFNPYIQFDLQEPNGIKKAILHQLATLLKLPTFSGTLLHIPPNKILNPKHMEKGLKRYYGILVEYPVDTLDGTGAWESLVTPTLTHWIYPERIIRMLLLEYLFLGKEQLGKNLSINFIEGKQRLIFIPGELNQPELDNDNFLISFLDKLKKDQVQDEIDNFTSLLKSNDLQERIHYLFYQLDLKP